MGHGARYCWNCFEPAQQSAMGSEPQQAMAVAWYRAARARHAREVPARFVFSAGAWLAANLACAMPDAVASVGVLTGGPYRCAAGRKGAIQCVRHRARRVAAAVACGPTRGVRVWLWHDDAVYRAARAAPMLEPRLAASMGRAWSGRDARGTNYAGPARPPATKRMPDFLLPAP